MLEVDGPGPTNTTQYQYNTGLQSAGRGWAGASSGASQLIWMESRQKYTAQPSPAPSTLELQTKVHMKVLNHGDGTVSRCEINWDADAKVLKYGTGRLVCMVS